MKSFLPTLLVLFSILLTGLCTNATSPTSDQIGTGVGIASTCLNAVFASVPPTFCWKANADVGVIPTGCPAGWFRILALCMQNCPAGWSFDGASLCLQDCPGGYTWMALTCYQWWLPNTISRNPYFTASMTNFDSRIPCPAGMYKGGALCYRDCGILGLVNCGPGACSATGAACASSLINMGVAVISAIVQSVTLVLSFGTEAAVAPGIDAAKTGLSTLLTSAKDAASQALQVIKNIAVSSTARATFLNTVKSNAISFVKGQITSDVVSVICNAIGNSYLDSTNQQAAPAFNASTLIPFNPNATIQACQGISSANGTNAQLGCAQSIISFIAPLDPTGLLGVAAAFMQPTCNV